MSEKYKRHSESEYTSSAKRRRSDDTPVPPLYLIFNGEVASVQPYGIFVKIPGSRRQGLVHKSQISKSRVDDPSEMFAKGEMVYCKIISIDYLDGLEQKLSVKDNSHLERSKASVTKATIAAVKKENGDKIGLAMKTVNQTTGKDLDPNNIELSQDEKKRKQGGFRQERQKIELDAVFDTTCKKCGGKGHLAQDCFKTEQDKTYELIPEMDEYMKSLSQTDEKQSSSHSRKKKKKEKKEKKEKKKKKHKKKYSSSSDSDSDSERSPKKHKKKKRHHRRSYSSNSDG